MIEPFQQMNNNYLIIDKWMKASNSLLAGFSTRLEGKSVDPYHSLNLGLHVGDTQNIVIENRRILGTQINFPLTNWVCAEQVHRSEIYRVTKKDVGAGSKSFEDALSGIDGLYTNEKDVLLTACFADCVPIFYYAPDYHFIGIAHAGWKGTVAKIATKMVERWIADEGIPPESIQVMIGPAICKQCYEVDKEVIQQVLSILPPSVTTCYTQINENKYMLDLKELNRHLLLESGIRMENLLTTGYCTSCDNNLFFSHRKESGSTGRMIGFIGFRKE